MSQLFRAAQNAVKQAARQAYQRSTLGRTMRDLERAARAGSLSPQEVQRFSRRLTGLAGRRVADDLLRQLGIPEVERYSAQGVSGRKLVGAFLDALGPVGKLLRSFSRPTKTGGTVSLARELRAAASFLQAFGHVALPPAGTGTSREQQQDLANLLRSMGWKVTEGRGDTTKRTGRPRTTTDVDFGGPKLATRVSNKDELITGEMIPVSSSNVHSIGFRIDPGDSSRDLLSSKGTLLIRFLAGKDKSIPGPTYEYHDVPAQVFRAFRQAASKGEFVWDSIRVRGTVSGHKYSYDLAGIVGGYVPRQAGLKRGEQGEFFLNRRFHNDSGVFESRLPEQRVRSSGPNRAAPNRALPNRGAPNRGRR